MTKLTAKQRELLERMAAGEWILFQDVFPESGQPFHSYLEHRTKPWVNEVYIPHWMVFALAQVGLIQGERFTPHMNRFAITDAGRAALKGEGE